MKLTDVTRVYMSRGDNMFDSDGRKSDKFIGIATKDHIYWIDQSVTTPQDVFDLFCDLFRNDPDYWNLTFNKMQHNRKTWFYLQKTKTVIPITRIKEHHDDIFMEGKKYIQKAVMSVNPENGNPRIWWTESQFTSLIG